MGCAVSRIDQEERVRICKERRRFMKQVVYWRGEFGNALLAYLRALKNTGVTLRQFTESESLDLENNFYCLPLPRSPPLPLPPSPPPPPSFSPDSRKSKDEREEVAQQSTSIEEGDCSTRPPPIILSTSWNFWDPFESTVQYAEKSEIEEPLGDKENWAETKSDFEEDDDDDETKVDGDTAHPQMQKLDQDQIIEAVDDNSSTISRDNADIATVLQRTKKTLEGIVKELDDYFLKASASGNELLVLIDVSGRDISVPPDCKENKGKGSNSAKVFNALSWNWSSKSLQSTKDSVESLNFSEPCKAGAHCITLEKLFGAVQKLYKDIKDEEMTKLELEKKTMLLLKQEEDNQDLTKIVKTRSIVEGLETDIRRLQHSISTTSSSVFELIVVELYPQLVVITSGLRNMWRTMYDCHQIQFHLSEQLKYLTDCQITDFVSDSHRQATLQLAAEVTSWYNSFCRLVLSQKEYVGALCGWMQRTHCLGDDHLQISCLSAVHRLCREWPNVLDQLPYTVTMEAIKGLVAAIEAIMIQQTEEYNLHKKSDKLEKKLLKERTLLSEMEQKIDWRIASGESDLNLSPKHPISIKRAKTDVLKKRVDAEKAKHLNSVQATRVMTLNNLKTSLPNVFRLLMDFSNASVEAYDAVLSHDKPEVDVAPFSQSSVSEIS